MFVLEKHDGGIHRQFRLFEFVRRRLFGRVHETEQSSRHTRKLKARVLRDDLPVYSLEKSLELFIRDLRQAALFHVSPDQVRKVSVIDTVLELSLEVGGRSFALSSIDKIQKGPLGAAQIVELEMDGLVDQRFKVLLFEMIIVHQHDVDLPLKARGFRQLVWETFGAQFQSPFIMEDALYFRHEIRLDGRVNVGSQHISEPYAVRLADRAAADRIHDCDDFRFKNVSHSEVEIWFEA